MNENTTITDEVIYHYTTVDAFFNILQSKTLWLSSIANMNDSHEIGWCLNKLNKILSTKITDENRKQIETFWLHTTLNVGTPYIACFSKNPDLLSQWRAYADDGHGIAIGFNKSKFSLPNTLPVIGYCIEHTQAILDVIYDEILQDQILEKFTCRLDGVVDVLNSPINISQFSFLFKNPAFKEENEIRIVHRPMVLHGEQDNHTMVVSKYGDIKFRTCKNKILSYFELPFQAEQIDEIVLGPKSHLRIDELKSFLGINGYTHTKIKYSSATYR